NSFFPHVYLRGQLALEDGFAQSTREALERLGHHVVHSSTCGMGGTITKRNPHTGILATSSDPRRSCYAIGW
ncbi:MAG: gamma-glutamyltransferase, partial [Gammaproteobacteria bacterium]|nr:gamma-glutamyltransferase [Gammaproteobacteria bacterium]